MRDSVLPQMVAACGPAVAERQAGRARSPASKQRAHARDKSEKLSDASARSRVRACQKRQLAEQGTRPEGECVHHDPWVLRIFAAMAAPHASKPRWEELGTCAAWAPCRAGLYGVNGRRAAVLREAEQEPDLGLILILAAACLARNDRTNSGAAQ